MMKKAPLYSRSRTPGRSPETGAAPETPTAVSLAASPGPSAQGAASFDAGGPVGRPSRFRRFLARHERRFWAGSLVLLVVAGFAFTQFQQRARPPLTIQQIDAAVRKSIAEKPLPSASSRAFAAIMPSVVRVVSQMGESDDEADGKPDAKPDAKAESKRAARSASRNGKPGNSASSKGDGNVKPHGPVESGVGTGVVIMENGTILTNLHVVNGAKSIKVTFFDGLESEAVVLSTQPENDLAVLRAKRIPDDLQPATMRSTGDLAPGDEVIAVGFPFGIGPSVSEGIVSGLKREFRSPEGQQTMTNLIQFDAAANPGNSGGPLVTMDGEVVGIVTAILNPSHQRVFIGIGFAVPIENAAAAAGMPPF
ncbi:hypothetical protein BH11PSE8_BH11PSE8_10850 [soil metagenome]